MRQQHRKERRSYPHLRVADLVQGMAVGYRTQLCSLLVWVLTMSLHIRNKKV